MESRCESQKQKLRLSGVKRFIYLLEGDLRTDRKIGGGEDQSRTFRTVEAETQLQARKGSLVAANVPVVEDLVKC